MAVVESQEPPPFAGDHDRHRDKTVGSMFEKDLPGIAGDLAQIGDDDFAQHAPPRPVIEAAVLLEEWHVVIARIIGDRCKPRLGPIIATALDGLSLTIMMRFEKRDPAHLRGV